MSAITPPWLLKEPPPRAQPVVEEEKKPLAPRPPPLEKLPPKDPNRKKLHAQSKERIARRTEENLTPRMKENRDRFINEYLKCFNVEEARIRAGGSPITASKIGNQYMHEPYVLKKIQELQRQLEDKHIITRQEIIIGLVQEARYHGPGSTSASRIMALSKLSTIFGMDAPIKVEGKVLHGVMMVPMPASRDEWAQIAADQQKLLKEDVRK